MACSNITHSSKELIATKVTGTVKWFNVKLGYGFINRHDTDEDVFIHHSAIARNNPRKLENSVGDGEIVVFDVVVGERGSQADNVTGPSGKAVQGSKFAIDLNGRRHPYYFGRESEEEDDSEEEDHLEEEDHSEDWFVWAPHSLVAAAPLNPNRHHHYHHHDDSEEEDLALALAISKAEAETEAKDKEVSRAALSSRNGPSQRLQPAEDLHEELQCPVCLEMFRMATTLGCGHTFCADCLQDVRAQNGDQCPLCRAHINSSARCIALDNVVKSLVAKK